MTHISRSVAIVLLLLGTTSVLAAPHPRISAAEKQKIESLIAAVEALPDAVFVRNGKAYKPATAARFLRGKWEDRSREILSAQDFIEKVATRSSTTGRVYLVRFQDGREIPTAAFFRAKLETR